MKKVTLCLPNYNSEQTITETLKSLVNQTYPIYKLKIFDNISTDNSVAICKEFAKEYSFIEIYINEKNLGGEGNFTRCLEAAEGDYTAVVHSDDIYDLNFVERAIDIFENNSDCVASFCRANEIDSEGIISGSRFFPKELLGEKKYSLIDFDLLLKLTIQYGNFITCPSVIARSDIYKNEIKFWDGFNFKTSADLDVWIRLARLGRIAAISETLINYRVAEASYSYRIAKKRTTRHDLFLVLDKQFEAFTEVQKKRHEKNLLFLKCKDNALRSLNIYRCKIRNLEFPILKEMYFSVVLNKMFSTKWHFKYGSGIIMIYLMSWTLNKINWNYECQK